MNGCELPSIGGGHDPVPHAALRAAGVCGVKFIADSSLRSRSSDKARDVHRYLSGNGFEIVGLWQCSTGGHVEAVMHTYRRDGDSRTIEVMVDKHSVRCPQAGSVRYFDMHEFG